MSLEEAVNKYKKALEEADTLYEEKKINTVELSALKSEIDNQYRKDLSECF